ncbi:hypothetical protein J6Q66_05645, partial [bacterium]|nr:hypothetical protein [bacterium]
KASRTLFFMEHQEKGKQTQYSILERLKNPEANNSADYYLNGKILATAHSKEMLNKVYIFCIYYILQLYFRLFYDKIFL